MPLLLSITTTPPPPPKPKISLLSLPLELRLEIYTHLLHLPLPPHSGEESPPYRSTTPPLSTFAEKPKIWTAILYVSRQIYIESHPLLYKSNTFSAHPTLLTSSPTLYPSSKAYKTPLAIPLPPLPPPPPTTTTPQQDRPFTPPSQSQNIITIPLSPFISAPTNPPSISPAYIPLIRKWRLRIKLDSPAPWSEDLVREVFTGVGELTLDVWQSSFWGGVGVRTLKGFEGVRGVGRVRVRGMLGGFEGYRGWLEGIMGEGVGVREGEVYEGRDEEERRRLRGWS
ncbi:hypothetical protein QC762_203295 [Podospora pseudocomata]|uniref:F-box domain-containing protein n=1 Tax=Podospora pseudocomata TaxID=2093779 RepID=A0ABR0GQV1_9PEZI|nr:hypothetical protein QC762_203295 [Podospora pseudocomata]